MRLLFLFPCGFLAVDGVHVGICLRFLRGLHGGGNQAGAFGGRGQLVYIHRGADWEWARGKNVCEACSSAPFAA